MLLPIGSQHDPRSLGLLAYLVVLGFVCLGDGGRDMSGLEQRLLASVGGIENFQRNWSWRSHSAEKRAQQAISSAVAMIENGIAILRTKGATDEQSTEWTDKAIRLWLAYEAAGARTANPMITGPANFPIARNNKAMAVERKRGEEYYSFVEGAKGWFARRERSAEQAALSAESANTEHRTLEFDGVKLVQNTTLNRVQIVFDGKPGVEAIALLKASAFRWSPREGAWQRQNTNNGVQASYRVLKALGYEKGTLAKPAIASATSVERGTE
jgi:hypothetical protein